MYDTIRYKFAHKTSRILTLLTLPSGWTSVTCPALRPDWQIFCGKNTRANCSQVCRVNSQSVARRLSYMPSKSNIDSTTSRCVNLSMFLLSVTLCLNWIPVSYLSYNEVASCIAYVFPHGTRTVAAVSVSLSLLLIDLLNSTLIKCNYASDIPPGSCYPQVYSVQLTERRCAASRVCTCNLYELTEATWSKLISHADAYSNVKWCRLIAYVKTTKRRDGYRRR